MIVDCNATLGNWPFRPLRHSAPQAFLELMDLHGIAQAWVSPFEGLLYKAVQEANLQLSAQIASLGDRLVQIPVINPAYPGWEDDVAYYLDRPLPGFRLHPSYHGYTLEDESCGELLERVAEAGRFVQLSVRVQDERQHHPLVMVAPVDLSAVPALTRRFPQMPFIVLNASTPEIRPLVSTGVPANLFLDIANVESVGGVGDLPQEVGAEHFLFGSHAALFYIESSILKLREADLSDTDRELILNGNAMRLWPRS